MYCYFIAEGLEVLLKIKKELLLFQVIKLDIILKELYDYSKENIKSDIVQCTGLAYEIDDIGKYLTKEQRKIDSKIKSIIILFLFNQTFLNF